MDDVLLTGGGIIPENDMKSLSKLGVGKLFSPGTPASEIADYIKAWGKGEQEFLKHDYVQIHTRIYRGRRAAKKNLFNVSFI